MNSSKLSLPLLAFLSLAKIATAEIVYEDDFTGAALSSDWNITIGTPVTLDDPNDQADYDHVAGTSRRFLNYNDLLVSKTGYFKAEISNLVGASVWIGFVNNSHGNNANYAQTLVNANGTYEMFFNNTTGSLPFDNGAGWTGTLAAGAGTWTTDGGTTEAALIVGGSFPNDSNIFGFGFANFGNGGVFPSSSFSIDSVNAGDSLTVVPSGNTAPTVNVTAPADSTTVAIGSTVNFTATANDTDDGDLGASVTWTSDLDGNLGTGASISASSLSLGTHTITASVTDSGSLSGDDSITITVNDPSNTPPTVTITSPTTGTEIDTGTLLSFSGTASDVQDGNLTASLSWTSSIDGNIGTGASFSTSALSTGTHLITASTVDSGTLAGDDSITIVVSFNGATRPNIIVIICDDAGYADFEFMNGLSGETSEVPTPHLNALADRGVTFSRAYVAANCQPTRAAMVTGAYQARIGNENVGNNNFLSNQIFEGVPVETDTVWDRMKALGYSTGAIGKWHLGSIADTPTQLGNRPENQGIDEFYGFWHGSRNFLAGSYNEQSDPTNPLQLRYIREAIVHPDGSKTDTVVEYSKYADVPSAPQYITNILGDYAEQFVADHHADPDPFFLYVAHPAPHKPWTNESPDYNDPRITSLAPVERRQVASMMITMDKEIGDLMDQLEDPNEDGDTSDSIVDNTLVIFINDNGGVSGGGTDNGILNGVKGSPHDGGICVPMIMAGAGIDPSLIDTVFDKPVHGIDILPTSVALGGGTIDPVADKVDGVNLIPFINGENTNDPHDVLVHRWRGTFSVIDGDWKLVNTHNTDAGPDRYRLYNLATDRGETNSIISDPTHANRVEAMKRDLTDHEATWDKPRYPILARTLETEPLNIFDHFVFRPGLSTEWDGGAAYSGSTYTGGVDNWFRAGTTEAHQMYWSDSFTGAVLEFPVHNADYTANNDMRRKTGMEFMLNKIILSGDFSESTDHTATMGGNDILFTNTLAGVAPEISNETLQSGTNQFTYDLDLNIQMYHDLTLSGDGPAQVNLNGELTQHFADRGLKKTGTSSAAVTGTRTYAGDTTVEGGTLSFGQANPNDEAATVTIAQAGATLELLFSGTDTVDKLFIGGVQQPAGVYEAVGNPGSGIEIPQITGSGTLTVVDSPEGYSQWAGENAPGQAITEDHDNDGTPNGIEYFMGESGSSFTPNATLDASLVISWPMGTNYLGDYSNDYYVETSPNLIDWTPVSNLDVTINPGLSVSYSLPSSLDTLFARLAVIR
ncbi:MAG: sulfatase-like hydrolase/transferase [Roseibacillus sp.]